MKILICLLTLSFLQLTAYAETCSYVVESKGGFLEFGSEADKELVETEILKSYDRFVYPLGNPYDLSACMSVPVEYSCTANDNCTQYCVASTVTELGDHINSIYRIKQCAQPVNIETLEFENS